MPVLPRALEIQGEITAIRRDIHAHPELAYEESRTSDIVAAKLQQWGLEVTRGLGKTGLGKIASDCGCSRGRTLLPRTVTPACRRHRPVPAPRAAC